MGMGKAGPKAPDKTEEEITQSGRERSLKQGVRQYGCCISSSVEIPKEELKDAFDALDPEDDGRLDYDQLKHLITVDLGMDQSFYEDIRRKNEEQDQDGLGEIQWEDLERWITGAHASRNLTRCEMIYKTFDDPACSVTAKAISTAMLGLIVISSFCFVLETDPSMMEPDPTHPHLRPRVKYALFNTVEIICVLAFTLEYLGRLLTVWAVRPDVVKKTDDDDDDDDEKDEDKEEGGDPELKPPATGLQKTWAFFISPMNLIDFAAIFPFYLELMLGSTGIKLSVLRILRVMRVFRMFKLGKYNTGLLLFMKTFASAGPALILLIFFFVLDVVLFGAMLYFVEGGDWYGAHQVCPNVGTNGGVQWMPDYRRTGIASTCKQAGFVDGVYLRPDVTGSTWEPTPFMSILHAMWCIVTTATTVGYGDVYPTSPAGKLIATGAVLGGLIVLALPITVIGTSFQEHYDANAKKKRERELAKKLKADHAKRARDIIKAQKRKTDAVSKHGNGEAAVAAQKDADMQLLLTSFHDELLQTQQRVGQLQETFQLILHTMQKPSGAATSQELDPSKFKIQV